MRRKSTYILNLVVLYILLNKYDNSLAILVDFMVQ